MTPIWCLIIALHFSIPERNHEVYCAERLYTEQHKVVDNPFYTQIVKADKRMTRLVLLCREKGIKGCLIKYGKSPLSYNEFLRQVKER